MLNVNDLTVTFGGVVAVDHLSFDVAAGQIFALIGPNGAGKTTVFNAISRFYPASGTIFFQGSNLMKVPPHRIAQQGIARTFQNIELFHSLTVMDNLLLAARGHHPAPWYQELVRSPGVGRAERQARARVDETLAFLGLEKIARSSIGQLPFGTLKTVELARCLVMDPTMIMLDEPVAGMNAEESLALADIIVRIRDSLHLTILLVEHDMSVVMRISDHIVVMNFGKKLAEGDPEYVRNHPEVIEAYLGREDTEPRAEA